MKFMPWKASLPRIAIALLNSCVEQELHHLLAAREALALFTRTGLGFFFCGAESVRDKGGRQLSQ